MACHHIPATPDGTVNVRYRAVMVTTTPSPYSAHTRRHRERPVADSSRVDSPYRRSAGAAAVVVMVSEPRPRPQHHPARRTRLALFRTKGQPPCSPAALGWDHPRRRWCYLTLHTSIFKLAPPIGFVLQIRPRPYRWRRPPVETQYLASPRSHIPAPTSPIGFVSQNRPRP
jgi:hypothetical protein